MDKRHHSEMLCLPVVLDSGSDSGPEPWVETRSTEPGLRVADARPTVQGAHKGNHAGSVEKMNVLRRKIVSHALRSQVCAIASRA